MNSQELFLIIARADNGVIGRDNGMPWHLPADLKRFKTLTMGPENGGRAMIMGRKTFDSFPAPLPGRRHIVLTRDRQWRAHGAEVAHSVGEALELAGPGTVAVIGGADIYAQFLPLAEWIELTEVHGSFEGDVSMPAFGPEWREVAREEHAPDDGKPGFAFVTLKRAL
ncbi:MAG: dihydrofolate reductase [Novosphingobium sp.]